MSNTTLPRFRRLIRFPGVLAWLAPLLLALVLWLLWSGSLPRASEALLAPKPTHEASTLLFLQPHQSLLGDHRREDEKTEAFAFRFQQRQAVLLRSNMVLITALKANEVANLPLIKAQKDPVEWLYENLEADTTLGSEFIRVRLTGTNPEELAKIVDAVVSAFMKEIVLKDHYQRLDRINQLQEIARVFEEKVRAKRDRLREL